MPSPLRALAAPGRRLLRGRSGPPPQPPVWLAADPGGLTEWEALWALPVAEVWTSSDHGLVARLASMRSRAGMPGSRNAAVQTSIERALFLNPVARRHAGIAVEGDVVAEGPVGGGPVSAFADEDASGVVVFDAAGVVLERFGELTEAGRRELDGKERTT